MEPAELKTNLIQEGPQELSELQKEILARLSKDPNGLDIDVLYEKIAPKFTSIQQNDWWPIMIELVGQGLIRNFWRYIESNRVKIAFRLAKYSKPSLRARLQCLLKGHDVPADSAYEAQGALMRGGYCRRCFKLIEIEFLGNTWTEVVKHENRDELKGHDISAASNRGLKVFQIP